MILQAFSIDFRSRSRGLAGSMVWALDLDEFTWLGELVAAVYAKKW